MLQAALGSETGVFHDSLTPSTVSSYLYKVVGCSEPHHVAAGEIAVLGQVCKSAAEAYTRLIAAKKK